MNKIEKEICKIVNNPLLKPLSKIANNISDVDVTILCITYNHQDFLEKCITGFLEQKVDFNVKIIIHDDASTDKTREIIEKYAKKYPNLIVPIIEKENQYSKHDGSIGKRMFKEAKGAYVAMCEGDDYWDDPYKLAIQYHLMEKYKDCRFCVHKVKTIDVLTNEISYRPRVAKIKTSILHPKKYFEIISANFEFQTTSYFRRFDDYANFINNPPKFTKTIPTGDEKILLYFGSLGNILYIDRTMSVYNKFNPGSWTLKNSQKTRPEKLAWAKNVIDSYEEFNLYTKNKFAKSLNKKIFNFYLWFFPDDKYLKVLMKKHTFRWFIIKNKSIKTYCYFLLKYNHPNMLKLAKKIRKIFKK